MSACRPSVMPAAGRVHPGRSRLRNLDIVAGILHESSDGTPARPDETGTFRLAPSGPRGQARGRRSGARRRPSLAGASRGELALPAMARLCERPGCSERGGGVRLRRRSSARVAGAARPRRRADACRRAVQAPRRCDGGADRLDARRPARSEARAVPNAAGNTSQAPRPPVAGGDGRPPGRRAARRAPVAGWRRNRGDAPDDDGRRISGAQPDDPDATVAMPWMPEFDVDDEVGELLHADSPLLARAFRGSRPRPTRRR